MKMNYSNAMMINTLAKNYQMKQQLNSSNSNYFLAGILSGIVVGGALYYYRYKYTSAIISNLTNQNLKLRLENESQRFSINELTSHSNVKPIMKESDGNDKSPV
jgi:hypothetical protein